MLLEADNLQLSFGSRQILNNTSFRIAPGETVGLIGPNGSGKTTLFNCLSGFHYPQAGSIIFNEQDITHLRPSERAKRGIGRVFQNFGIFRQMSVQDNLRIALEGRQSFWKNFFPISRQHRENLKKTVEYAAQAGLESKLKDKAGSLSGGQMRLLEIISTLAFGADLFLLDEPTAGVAPKMKKQVVDIIRHLQQPNKTVLIIEHDINFIQQFCDRIIVLDVGHVVLDDTPENVRNSTELQNIYFG